MSVQVRGIVAADGSDRLPTQAEMDEALAAQLPFMEAFAAMPEDHKLNALVSLIASVCVHADDPAAMFNELIVMRSVTAIHSILTQQEGTRQ